MEGIPIKLKPRRHIDIDKNLEGLYPRKYLTDIFDTHRKTQFEKYIINIDDEPELYHRVILRRRVAEITPRIRSWLKDFVLLEVLL